MINLNIDMKQCRICLQEDNIDNLIYPCKCNGYIKYVHSICLNKWRQMNDSPTKMREDKCDICSFFFIKKGIPLKRNNFFKLINNHFLTMILLVIFLLTFYSCLIYAIDATKKLAKLINLYGNNLQTTRIYFIINYCVWVLLMKCVMISEFKRMNKMWITKYILYKGNCIYLLFYIAIVLHYTIGWNYTNIVSDILYGLFIELSILQRHIYIINKINEEMDEIINYK